VAVYIRLWDFAQPLEPYSFDINCVSASAPTIFLVNSKVLFLLMVLIVISWVRSGICFQQPGVMRLAVELLLCFLGAVLMHRLTPGSVFGWGLGVWMFFLVQALYFVFFAPADNQQEESSRLDAFERASRQAERILSNPFHQ
jgi:hypothetical protein